jgi:hypothetical protein
MQIVYGSLQAEQHVIDLMLRSQNVHYPAVWEGVEEQSSNLRLYDVPLQSNEVISLVQEAENSDCKVLKVGITHR